MRMTRDSIRWHLQRKPPLFKMLDIEGMVWCGNTVPFPTGGYDGSPSYAGLSLSLGKRLILFDIAFLF